MVPSPLLDIVKSEPRVFLKDASQLLQRRMQARCNYRQDASNETPLCDAGEEIKTLLVSHLDL